MMTATTVTPRTLQAAQLVAARPGIARAEVAASMGCAARTAGIHLRAAKAAGLVRVDGVGRYARWYAAAPFAGMAAQGWVPVASVWEMGARA